MTDAEPTPTITPTPLGRCVATFARVGRTPGSLLRVLGWVLLFVALADEVVPVRTAWAPSRHREQPDNLVMPTYFGDHRGFRTVTPPRAGPDEFRIAWIAGSSVNVRLDDEKDRRQLSAFVADEIRGRTNLEPVVLRYTLEAMRVFDAYICLQHALAQDPDVIVFTFNPMFLYARSMPVKRRYMFGAAAGLLPADPGAWLDFASLSTPGDWLRGAAMPWFDRVYAQGNTSRGLRDTLAPMRSIDPNPGPMAAWLADHRAAGALAGHDNPDMFWQAAIPRVLGEQKQSWHAYALSDLVDTTPGSLNDRWIDRTLSTLAASDVAALVYLAPLAPKATQQGRMESVLAIEAAVRAKAEWARRPGLTIIPENLSRHVGGAEFLDFAHLRLKTNELPDYLAETILTTYEAWWNAPGDER